MDLTMQEMAWLVHQDFVRELWTAVGLVTAVAVVIVSVFVLADRCGASDRIHSFRRNHPFQFAFAFLIATALAIYAVTKTDVIVPSSQQCDYRQGSASVSVSGTVEYYRSASTTNLNVALWSGTSTQSVSFVAGDFLYAYDTTTGGGPASPAQSPFWVRDATSNEWTMAVQRGVTNSASKAAVVAYLPQDAPKGTDPQSYRFWFIGPQSNLPEVVIEGGVGIIIDQTVITSSSVYIRFHPEDPDLATSMYTYVLQTRISRDGVLGEWTNIASVQSRGISGSSFLVNGYTVGEYREYRIYADKDSDE